MWRHCVYIHRKADDGVPFYVGKATLKKRRGKLVMERPYCRTSRSQWWHRTVAKHGLAVEIVAMFPTDAAAQAHEMALIEEIGRANLGKGSLINLTDGGDGQAGIIMSASTRAKHSANAKKPRTEAWVNSIRAARKNGGNGGVVKRGDKLPDWWRERISNGVRGNNNPMFGKTGEKHPTSRRVVDLATGESFPSVTAAARAIGVRMQTLHNMLTGFRPNCTAMRFT